MSNSNYLADVIVCDPPWAFNDKLLKMKKPVKRSAQSHYSVLSMNDIKNLKVQDLANPEGCLLALWVPGSMLQDGLDVMKAWGFTQKQTFDWVKIKKDAHLESDLNNITRIGMGRLFRQCHELVLIGTSGKSIYKKLQDNSQRSTCFDINKGHSVKTELLQDRLDIMFPNTNRLEMFGRRNRKDWTVIGNEVSFEDITVSIDKLKGVYVEEEGENENE